MIRKEKRMTYQNYHCADVATRLNTNTLLDDMCINSLCQVLIDVAIISLHVVLLYQSVAKVSCLQTFNRCTCYSLLYVFLDIS